MSSFHYFAIFKPYGYLSQFSQEVAGQKTLKDIHDFPPNVYPVGRLDKNSEGLLILTDDTSLNKQLLQPSENKLKTYLVQVEGKPTDQQLATFREPMKLRIKQKIHITKPATVRRVDRPGLFERSPPIRVRKNIPDSWIELSISEGKFHQVRKMCADIGFPVLRLIRIQIGNYRLPAFENGTVWTLQSSREILPDS